MPTGGSFVDILQRLFVCLFAFNELSISCARPRSTRHMGFVAGWMCTEYEMWSVHKQSRLRMSLEWDKEREGTRANYENQDPDNTLLWYEEFAFTCAAVNLNTFHRIIWRRLITVTTALAPRKPWNKKPHDTSERTESGRESFYVVTVFQLLNSHGIRNQAKPLRIT